MKLRKNDLGIFYIHDYIPEYKWNNYGSDEILISERLVRYKDENKEFALNFFTNELTEAIIELLDNIIGEYSKNVVLVAVPPSKVDKYSPVRLSISRIRYNSEIKSKLKYTTKIFDGGELLIRTKDVSTSHNERRAKYHEHILSIDFNEELAETFNDDAIYIILDDITTTGSIMDVCRDILMDYDIESDKIYRLAIGSTI